jgi:TolA-binding protein
VSRVSDKLRRHDIKEDRLVTWTFQGWDWIQNHVPIVLGALGAVAVLVLLGLYSASNARRAEADAGRTLAEASMNYWQGNYPRSIALSDQIIEAHGSTRAARDARRLKADSFVWQGEFGKAAELSRDYLKRNSRNTPLKTAVEQSLANALESDQKYAEAARIYEELAGKAPDRTTAADFYMGAARSYRAAAQNEDARRIYEKLASEYADTPYARDAEVAMGELLAQAK